MKKLGLFFIAFIFLFGSVTVNAEYDFNEIFLKTGEYIYNTVENPSMGTLGGEWAVLGLARSEFEVPEGYFEKYAMNAENYISERNGILHERKYTEYSRVIIALTAIGENPENIAGFNLLSNIADYKKTVWQGLNGAVYALLAFDSGDYEIPRNSDYEVQATRELYIERILSAQKTDGGFSVNTAASSSDTDITAMALQALAKYTDNKRVKESVDRALAFLSESQNANGGYSVFETENSESVSQVITALCELGIPLSDPRFIKNGVTLADSLMRFYCHGGGFCHTLSEELPNLMATEQAYYALTAVSRVNNGKTSLYRIKRKNFISDEFCLALRESCKIALNIEKGQYN